MSVTLEGEGDYARIALDAVTGITAIQGYTEDLSGSIEPFQLRREYRWSLDGESFSAWAALDDADLSAIPVSVPDELTLEFRYTLESGGPVTVASVGLDATYHTRSPYAGKVPPQRLCERGNVAGIAMLEDPKWKPYDLAPALRTLRTLSLAVNKLFGLDVRYWRATPHEMGADPLLLEYNLREAKEGVCMKVMVNNNEFPDNALSLELMGMIPEDPLEVHIDWKYWESVFGAGEAPGERDIIYFPVNNRIYKVDSCYLFRGFMQQPQYWKLALVKWENSSSVIRSDAVDDELESLATSAEKLFGDDWFDEGTDVADPQEFRPANISLDEVRDAISRDLRIVEEDIMNFSLAVSRSHYSLASAYTASDHGAMPVALTYKAEAAFPAGQDRTLTCWLRLTAAPSLPRAVAVASVAGGTVTLTAEYPPPGLEAGDWAEVTSAGTPGLCIVGSVTSVADGQVIIEVEDEVLAWATGKRPTWAQYTDLRVRRTWPVTVIRGASGGRGLALDAFSGWYFRLWDNGSYRYFFMDEQLPQGEWRALVLSVSNRFMQVSLNIWKIRWDPVSRTPETTDLERVYARTYTNVPRADRTAEARWQLIAGPADLANIRLMAETIEEERQATFLNQPVIHDAHLAEIIDDSRPRLRLPYLGKPK